MFSLSENSMIFFNAFSMLIDDAPCKIMEINMSKPGKHGEAKGRIVAIGI